MVTISANLQEEIGSHGKHSATDSGSMSPAHRDADRVIRKVVRSHEVLQVSPPASDGAAAASGSGAPSDADQLDDRDCYETMVDDFVRRMREESMREEAQQSRFKKLGERSVVDGENGKEGAPRRRRRKRRVSFKRLGSLGRPFYRAKVVEDKEPYECYRCHAKFPFKRDLERHLRLHSGAPLLPCDFCPQEFPTGRMLANHCSRKHGEPSLSELGQRHLGRPGRDQNGFIKREH